MRKFLMMGVILIINGLSLNAQGIIKGIIIEKTSNEPVEFVNVTTTNTSNPAVSINTATDKSGRFEFKNLAFGSYKISYSFIGFETVQSVLITIDKNHSVHNLGSLYLYESSNKLSEVTVVGKPSTFVNSIDRKTYNVGQDLMSKTGSVSDLMQNIPSVQVGIDGNVALRGSENVTILINGRPSSLMGTNRAAVLQQMPANTIEKIEIITNPSAKYKPDGTSGIINIVLKKNKSLGMNGSVSANVGNSNRYNGNLLLNYNPGKWNVFGGYSIRQDDRLRTTDTHRKRINLEKDSIGYFQLHSSEKSRPLSHIFRAGIDYTLNDNNKMGIASNFNYRGLEKNSVDTNVYQTEDFVTSKKYDRLRIDPEFEKDLELTAYFQHTFEKEGEELNADFTTSKSMEEEDNHYSNVYQIPSNPTTFDNTLIKQGGNETQFTLAYLNPFAENIKFETGYVLESSKSDMDFFGESFNAASNTWENDIEKINHFIYTQNIHVLYATYEHELGKFGILGGLRAEQTYVNSLQKTTATTIKNDYFKLYPSLHLSYKLANNHQLQLNYSHRIHRPEGDDMNPFPEYQDPYNLRVGNPNLKPADIHSCEMGYQFKKNKTTILSTLYYRYTYNGMSEITRFVNDSVKVTSKENLSHSSAAGLELIGSANLGEIAVINLGTNTYYSTIDASNLGYSNNKSILTWSANLSSAINLTKSSVWQINSNFQAENLTPQGKQLASFVVNTGFKLEVLQKKGTFILTVSDVFNSLRGKTIIDTPELQESIIKKRSARIVYLGFTYMFGSKSKKEKENALKYDNQL